MPTIRSDPRSLDRELARRGIDARHLAAAAGIPESTLSTARKGRPVRERTFRRLAAALVAIPLMEGAELLLGDR